MHLLECERLHLKASKLPCGDTEQCYSPTACNNLPEGACCLALRAAERKLRQRNFTRDSFNDSSRKKELSHEACMREHKTMGRRARFSE